MFQRGCWGKGRSEPSLVETKLNTGVKRTKNIQKGKWPPGMDEMLNQHLCVNWQFKCQLIQSIPGSKVTKFHKVVPGSQKHFRISSSNVKGVQFKSGYVRQPQSCAYLPNKLVTCLEGNRLVHSCSVVSLSLSDDVLLHAINSMPLISSSVLIPASYADIRPRLIDCVFLNRANVTCRWEPAVSGDTPVTSYTLVVERRPTKWVKHPSNKSL